MAFAGCSTLLSPSTARRPEMGCSVMGRSTSARCGLQLVSRLRFHADNASFGLGGHLARHPIQSHQTLARSRAGDASDTNPTPARQPTTIQTTGRRHGPVRHRRGRRGGNERDLVVANPRDHAIGPAHHHHKYLPNCFRQSRQRPGIHRGSPPPPVTAEARHQSRQKQRARRPTRPRPRASPTRRRLHPTPR